MKQFLMPCYGAVLSVGFVQAASAARNEGCDLLQLMASASSHMHDLENVSAEKPEAATQSTLLQEVQRIHSQAVRREAFKHTPFRRFEADLIKHAQDLQLFALAAAGGNLDIAILIADSDTVKANEQLVAQLVRSHDCAPSGEEVPFVQVGPWQPADAPEVTTPDAGAEQRTSEEPWMDVKPRKVNPRPLAKEAVSLPDYAISWRVVALSLLPISLLGLIPLLRASFRLKPVPERRAGERFACNVLTTLRVRGERHAGEILNISQGGCRLVRLPLLNRGERLTLEFRDMEIDGVIEWSGRHTLGMSFDFELSEQELEGLLEGADSVPTRRVV